MMLSNKKAPLTLGEDGGENDRDGYDGPLLTSSLEVYGYLDVEFFNARQG